MKRRIAVLIAVILVSVCFCSKKVEEPEKSLLWEISKEGETSYILGSIHVFKKEWYPLRDVVENSFARSDILVLETDLAKDKQVEHAAMLMNLGLYQGDETLEKNVSPKVFRMTKKLLKGEYNVDIEAYQKFKPWYLSLMITLLEVQKMGYDPEAGIDLYFYKKATGKKEIVGLENIDQYIKMFKKISGDDQEKYLDYTMKDLKRMRRDLNNLMTKWRRGDLDGIEEQELAIYEENPEFLFVKEILLDDRNVTMARRINELMVSREESFFFIVGTAHLFGETGILKDLEEQGYSLRQL